MIKGWNGPTRVVDGVGECPLVGVVRVLSNVWPNRPVDESGNIWAILEAVDDMVYATEVGEQRGKWICRSSEDHLKFSRDSRGRMMARDPILGMYYEIVTEASLNALAAEHGGTWRAAPEGAGGSGTTGA